MFNVKCKMKNVYYPFTDSNLSARNTVRGDTGRAGLGRHAGLPLQAMMTMTAICVNVPKRLPVGADLCVRPKHPTATF